MAEVEAMRRCLPIQSLKELAIKWAKLAIEATYIR
jgi:hypothetical protein